MSNNKRILSNIWRKLNRWETLLFVILAIVFFINSMMASNYLTIGNQINLFILYIEKIIVVLTMTFLIINGEIDLSAPSIMGLSACTMAYFYSNGINFSLAILISLLIGVACGIFNGFWVAVVGLNSLIVTLATLIGYRGLARVFVEDRSFGYFQEWFNNLGQKNLIGPFPFALILFFVMFIIALIILQYSGFGRRVFVIGNNKDVARYSGVNVQRVKFLLYIASGVISSLAGLLLAARYGAVRGDTAYGYELEIITIALLGGVNIFGGSGSLYSVFLSTLIILNVRNGASLAGLSGHFQTGIIGALLIFSILGPNISKSFAEWNKKRKSLIKPEKTGESNYKEVVKG
ncbi:MAG TPA: ABC transporter permease [Anaerolineae bacterium]|nr:ABC transporter permease [Anaerolineae bacterium]